MSEDLWLMRVDGGLAAHFTIADGESRSGVHWKIGLKRGAETHSVFVKALLTDDATRATRRDQEYQAQTVMHLKDLLDTGWHPHQAMDLVIHIGNPLPGAGPSPKKPWRKNRVTGSS